MLTKNGVCYEIKQSPYRYKENGLTFVFTSKTHLNKFKEKKAENRDIINYSLSKRFNYKVDVSELADIVLYRKIETRGFLILNHEGNELCQKNIQYVGGIVTATN